MQQLMCVGMYETCAYIKKGLWVSFSEISSTSRAYHVCTVRLTSWGWEKQKRRYAQPEYQVMYRVV